MHVDDVGPRKDRRGVDLRAASVETAILIALKTQRWAHSRI
jgi:hypothetical protein